MFPFNCGSQQWIDKYLTWLLCSELLAVQNNSPCKGRSITEDEDKLSSWENAEEKVSGFSSPIELSSPSRLIPKYLDFCACWLNFSSTCNPFIFVEWSLSSISWNLFKSTICCRIVCRSWSLYNICHDSQVIKH